MGDIPIGDIPYPTVGADQYIISQLQTMFNCTIIIIIKKVDSARLRERDLHPISPKTPAPQYQHMDRKKRKEKIIENYSTDRAS